MENRNAAIVTIDDYINYGNRLQNYALTKLLQNEGFQVFNGVRVYTKEDWINRTNDEIKKIVKRFIPFRILKGKLYSPQDKSGLKKEREKKFLDFVHSYTAILDPIICSSHSRAVRSLKKYAIDYFVVGSDQVWNPYYEAKEYEFLTFAPKDKRLSFAASIGANSIPDGAKWYFKKNLSNMKYISVREERAAEIVKELTGRTADITLDPTLLLDKADWEHVAKKPELYIESKYICTYFLGEVPEAVKAFAKEIGLPIYALNSIDSPELYTLDPAEFLYMIQNASYVLTDSFHAVAFSIKFNKEFYVFDRKQDGVSSMFSRIETITKRFGLENRIQNRDRIVEQEPVSNWNEIEDELVVEKNKSMGKLLEAMGI
ncbi:polysaccharide pyruvyl transferase family protein [Oribacterium sp. HCP3S3_B9]|uniref:polysaccharide pyruvyl transferase family protein n=1 Tax=Oribacterium sp. HCP3S3_B9 TaxID=3438946 RepID=UPI003F88644A